MESLQRLADKAAATTGCCFCFTVLLFLVLVCCKIVHQKRNNRVLLPALRNQMSKKLRPPRQSRPSPWQCHLLYSPPWCHAQYAKQNEKVENKPLNKPPNKILKQIQIKSSSGSSRDVGSWLSRVCQAERGLEAICRGLARFDCFRFFKFCMSSFFLTSGEDSPDLIVSFYNLSISIFFLTFAKTSRQVWFFFL